MPLPRPLQKTRKHLSADALYALLREAFAQLPEHRTGTVVIPLVDALMAAFCLFSLKDPSLLAFDARRHDQNLKNLFGLAHIPSDTHMRQILDDVDPELLRPVFHAVFRQLQRGKALEPFVFYQGCYLLALDGTGYFSSQKIHCDGCLQKVNKKTGAVTYHHQMLAAALVPPDHKEVIPLAPEPIQKQDGTCKNDCERNAAKRLIQKIRQQHPRLPLVVVEDGLASNGPHIRALLEVKMHFILGVKPGDHAYLFDRVLDAYDDDRVQTLSWQEGETRCEIDFVNHLPLKEANPDLLVHFVQYAEYDDNFNQTRCFSWITDWPVQRGNARLLVRGGRCRWKIENETFNTLKNQGYHYEHNFGHGERHLSVVFAMLMMLAFLVDQVQQRCCALFRAVWHKLGSKRSLWDKLRSHFYHFTFDSMHHLYEVILHDLAKELPAPRLDSS